MRNSQNYCDGQFSFEVFQVRLPLYAAAFTQRGPKMSCQHCKTFQEETLTKD